MKKFLMYLWQLPQNIIGLLLRLFIKGERKTTINGISVYYKSDFNGGISLGNTILVSSQGPYMSKHERGHQLQSQMLGPLYLFVIGIPSIIWAALYGTLIKETPNGYYKFYTEKWADKLGKVNR